MADFDGNSDQKQQNRIGHTVLNAMELVAVFIRENVRPESMEIALNNLQAANLHGEEANNEGEDPFNELTYACTELVETAMGWMMKKEIDKRGNQQPIPYANAVKEEIFDHPTEKSDDLYEQESSNDEKSTKKFTRKLSSTECQVCGKVCSTPSNLNVHKRIHMEDDDDKFPFPCTVCGKGFTHKTNMTRHMRSHLDDEESRLPYKCSECNKRYGDLTAFKLHKISHLPNNDPRKKELECEICGKIMYSKQGLAKHKRGHIEDDEARKCFQCDECDQRFMQKETLAKHKRTHLPCGDPNKKEFPCDICGKMLKRSDSLRTHMITHQNDETARKPFKCDDCDARYARFADLEDHKLNHLPEDDPRRKKLDCEICGKTLSGRAMSYHRKSHLDDTNPIEAEKKRPHKCEQCGVACRSAQGLRNHMNIHTGNYRFKCELCPEHSGFNSEWQLKGHLEHHKNGTLKKLKRKVKVESEADESYGLLKKFKSELMKVEKCLQEESND